MLPIIKESYDTMFDPKTKLVNKEDKENISKLYSEMLAVVYQKEYFPAEEWKKFTEEYMWVTQKDINEHYPQEEEKKIDLSFEWQPPEIVWEPGLG